MNSLMCESFTDTLEISKGIIHIGLPGLEGKESTDSQILPERFRAKARNRQQTGFDHTRSVVHN